MKKTLTLAMGSLVIVSPLAAQQGQFDRVRQLAAAVRTAITPDRLAVHTREIVRHERPSGSPGENAAIDYIVATLRAD